MTPSLDHSDRFEMTNRRDFLKKASIASMNLALASESAGRAAPAHGRGTISQSSVETGKAKEPPNGGKPLKLFCCDLNFVYLDKPFKQTPPSAPQDWAFIDPKAYFEWHKDFGVNVMFMQAYTFGGYAFYPTKLGAQAPGPGRELLPNLFELSRSAGMPFCSYFCVGADLVMSNMRDSWIVSTSRKSAYFGFLAPESPWTNIFCERIEEFLAAFPVDWMLFDWFVYGDLHPNEFAVQPRWFVRKPFAEIIGLEMPDGVSEITPAESLKYKREVLARQFYRIRDTVRRTSPKTKIGFNIPYWKPAEAIWANHPMLNESDFLFAESSNDVVGWLLEVRKPHQRVMTTIIGRPDGTSDPKTWKKWYEAGCDFFGYAWGTPPDFRPHPAYAQTMEITRRAYHEMP